MNFKTFSEKELNEKGKYMSYNQPHILISISNPKHKVNIPNSPYCKKMLSVQFDDIEQVTSEKVSFNFDIATRILNFVNEYCNLGTSIVVHCGAGVSRSIAVASALSKIINHEDDFIFSSGVPNMLVYTTLLDTYFTNNKSDNVWSSIYYLRSKSMKEKLVPVIFKIWEFKVRNRSKDKGEN